MGALEGLGFGMPTKKGIVSMSPRTVGRGHQNSPWGEEDRLQSPPQPPTTATPTPWNVEPGAQLV